MVIFCYIGDKAMYAIHCIHIDNNIINNIYIYIHLYIVKLKVTTINMPVIYDIYFNIITIGK